MMKMMDGKTHECCCGGHPDGEKPNEEACEADAVKMNAGVKDALDAQMNHELIAANAYRALSNWCTANEFSGFGTFFKNQATEEIEHAEKIMDHLLDQGELPRFTAQPKPRCCFESLLKAAVAALELEEANTRAIVEVYETAMAGKAYPTKILMEWFIEEQVEEEAWANRMVGLVKRAECPGALYNLDRHILKDLGGEG